MCGAARHRKPTNTPRAVGKCFLDMLGVFETNFAASASFKGIAKAKAAGVYKSQKPRIGGIEIMKLKEGVATEIAKRLGRASAYRALG